MDQKRNQQRDDTMPNRASNMEQAEGSRESIRNSDQSGSSRSTGNAGGITNRPLDREQNEQQQLPERGRAQSDQDRSRSDRGRSTDSDRSQSER